MTYTYKLSRRLASSHDPFRWLRPLVLLLLGLLATSCSKGDLLSPPPDGERATPGWITLNLITPTDDDGAVLLRVTGPAMDSLRLSGGQGFTYRHGDTARFLLTGRIASGPVARIWVADTRQAPSHYLAAVEEAAARGTYQLRALTPGYGAGVTR